MIDRFTGLPIEIKSITPEDVEKLLSNKHFLDKLKEKLYLLGGYGSNSGGTSSQWTDVTGGITYNNHVAIGANADVNGTGQINSYLQTILGVGTYNTILGLQETMTGAPATWNVGQIIKIGANFNADATLFAGTENTTATIAGNVKNIQIGTGVYNTLIHRGSGTITTAYTAPNILQNTSNGTLSDASAVVGQIINAGAGTITTGSTLRALAPTNTGTFSTYYGLLIESPTGVGTANYGAAIGLADNGTLWINHTTDSTTSAGGAIFGLSKDTKLYRSAANTLKTDGNLIVAGASTAANSVASIDATQTLTNKRVTKRVVTVNAPGATYWVGGTGNSNDATKYASSSGGTANTQRAPLLQDTAYYDANSGTGTVTINHYRSGTLNFSNCALTGISMAGAFADRFFVGDLILNPNVAMTQGGFADAVVFCGNDTQAITTAGTTFATHAYQITGTGTFNFNSSWTSTSTMTITAGTTNTNGYDFTCTSFAISGGTLNAGNTTFYVTNTGAAATPWSCTGGTLNMGTSNIIHTNSTAVSQTFAGGGKTYFNVILTPSGAGTFTITGSNTYNSLQMASAGTKTIAFTSTTTQTLLSDCFFRGTSGSIITIQAVTAASAFTLAYSGGTIRTDYISLKDCTASGNTPFYAGANSTNVSGNTNWTFAESPRAGGFMHFFR